MTPSSPDPTRPSSRTPEISSLIGTGQPQDLKVRVNPPAPSATPKADAAYLASLQWHAKHGHEKTADERLDTIVNDPRPATGWQTAREIETELSAALARAEQAESEVKRLTDKCIDIFRLVQERFHECGRFRDPNFQPGGE